MSEPSTRSGGVKTFAIRLPDDLHSQFVVVADMAGLSLSDTGVQAIAELVERRRADGALAAHAARALEEMETEAAARRAALQSLLGPTLTPESPEAGTGEPSPSLRGRKRTEPES